jgi:alpha-tubulin suppressor-like RCC1 family protein
MLVPKNGRLGAVLSAVAILYGAGLLPPPALAFPGPEAAAVRTARVADTGTRVGLKPVPLAAGTQHSLAVASDGTVLHWGMSIMDSPYIGPGDKVLQPTRMDHLDSVVATAGGDQINLALKSDGTVWSIGYPGLQQVLALDDIVAVDAGKDFALALKADGTVWQFDAALKPIQVSGLTGIVAVAMGAYYYASESMGDSLYRATALRKDGTVWTWTDANNVESMPELSEVVALAAGFDHHLALKSDGTVWAWGSNTCGQTGASIRTSWNGGSPGPDYSAHKVEGIGNVTAISAGGGYHFFTFGRSLALKSDGTVWQWGCDGTATFNPTPSQVAGLTRGLAIAAGGEHSLVLEEDGTVWAWGWNYYGQLGNGTRTSTFWAGSIVRTPVQTLGLPTLIINYFNEHGQPYNNEEYSYWYNGATQQWYRGSKGGQITPLALPPWKEQKTP